MTKKRMTIKELASHLSLSTATVSLALSGKGDAYRIAAATRKRIEEEASRLGYRPNHMAQSMRKGKSDTIGVVFPNITETFMNHVLGGIETAAEKSGCSLMIATSSFDWKVEAKNLEMLLDRQVDGIILIPYAPFRGEEYDDSSIRQVSTSTTPLVALDRYIPDILNHGIITDDARAARISTEHLIEEGCSRLAYLGFELEITTLKERYRGFHEAVEAAELGDDAVELLVRERNAESRDIRDWLEGLILSESLPEGFLVSSNGLALKLRALLMELCGSSGKRHESRSGGIARSGTSFPGGMPKIARFGEDSRYFPTGMTEISQPHKQMGLKAMEMLLHLIEGRTEQGGIQVLKLEMSHESGRRNEASEGEYQ